MKRLIIRLDKIDAEKQKYLEQFLKKIAVEYEIVLDEIEIALGL